MDGAEQQEPGTAGSTSPPGRGHGRELRKNAEAGVVTGVCAGLGEYTRVDPVVWRVAFAITGLACGTGLWLYIAAWMMMRDSEGGPAMSEQLLDRRFAPESVLSVLVLGLAAATALSLVGGISWGTLVLATPLILGLLTAHNRGVDLRQTFRDLPEQWRTSEPPPAAPEPEPAPAYYNPAQPWAAAPSGPIDLAVVGDRNARSTRESADGDTGEDEGEDREETARTAAERARRSAERARDQARRTRERRRAKRHEKGVLLFGLVFLAIVAATGITFGLTGGPSLSALLGPETGPVYLGSVVAIVGVALLAGTWVGNPRGLVVLGTLLTVLLVGVSSTNLTGIRIGTAEWRPTTAAEDREYHLTAGRAELDLTGMTLRPGDQVEVSASVRLGEIDVLAPDTARVDVRATTTVGRIRIDDSVRSGTLLDVSRSLDPETPGKRRPAEKADQREEPQEGESEPPVLVVRLASYGADMEVRRVTP